MPRKIIELNYMPKLVNVDCRVACAEGEVVNDGGLNLNPTHGCGDLRNNLLGDILPLHILSAGVGGANWGV